ncbi:hypothetical protein [Flavihumibacter petaseus]|nr:hypothetical protein [Flavihumibacter petaseus]
MEPIYIYVTDRVRAMRESHNISQEQIAEWLDRPVDEIIQMERYEGPYTYEPNDINMLAFRFKCSLHYFIPERPL